MVSRYRAALLHAAMICDLNTGSVHADDRRTSSHHFGSQLPRQLPRWQAAGDPDGRDRCLASAPTLVLGFFSGSIWRANGHFSLLPSRFSLGLLFPLPVFFLLPLSFPNFGIPSFSVFFCYSFYIFFF